jgi:nitrogen fixation/metabolism regulation signal transduction histidine kinase
LLALGAGLPGVIVTLTLLWYGGYSSKVAWTLGTIVAGTWLVVAIAVRERVVRPLQTLSNMVAALREGDFSLRARTGTAEDPLGLALLELNLLSDTLRSQRLGALEATSLLRAVMAEIDVAIFAFDALDVLVLANRAGERLLRQPHERMAGQTATTLGIAALLAGDTPRVYDLVFPERSGRWEVRRTTFRQEGRPHTLLVIADVTKSLREEELLAWQRLVRVLSHEINNSLAPIKSIAGSLQQLATPDATAPDVTEDLKRGLGIIGSRAEALQRFMSSYARLARLPAPRPQPLDVNHWVRRVASLETRLPVQVDPGPPITIQADGDQLDQALINLVRNAADAALETHGGVRVGWAVYDGVVDVSVVDDGPGLAATTNLFVPFFTTKREGSGIGLVLCRQVAEAHGGMVMIENRSGAKGCVATLRLPIERDRDRAGDREREYE